jgi:hypothetical protein
LRPIALKKKREEEKRRSENPMKKNEPTKKPIKIDGEIDR